MKTQKQLEAQLALTQETISALTDSLNSGRLEAIQYNQLAETLQNAKAQAALLRWILVE